MADKLEIQARQRRIVLFMDEHRRRTGRAPTNGVIAEKLGIPIATVINDLRDQRTSGVVRWSDGFRATTFEVIQESIDERP